MIGLVIGCAASLRRRLAREMLCSNDGKQLIKCECETIESAFIISVFFPPVQNALLINNCVSNFLRVRTANSLTSDKCVMMSESPEQNSRSS